MPEIISELRVLRSCRISDTQSKIKMEGADAKEEADYPCLDVLILELKFSHANLSLLASSLKPTLNYNSGLLAGME